MKFKKLTAILMAVMLALVPFTAFADDVIVADENIETTPDVRYAEAAVLMDLDSGRLLYAKNPQEKLYPASTTKMMTAIIALEECDMNDSVVATYEAIKDIKLDESHMGILIGEELTMEQLMNGMLVYSANDAANVIAIHNADSIEAFVDKMNAKAADLGMDNTHFSNVCGIHDDDHYTTAEDLAILGKYCMQNETFREIVKKPIYSMPPTNKYANERNLPSTNLFLSRSRSSRYLYQPCIGIKTGHTSKAGYCLVSAAEHDGIDLLAVVLKCDNQVTQTNGEYSYIDSKALLEFGFNNYKEQSIDKPGAIIGNFKVEDSKIAVSATIPYEIKCLLPTVEDKSAEEIVARDVRPVNDIKAPVKKGDVIGSVVYTYNGKQIGETQLVAANEVAVDRALQIENKIKRIISSPFVFIPGILIILIAAASISFSRKQAKKRARRRRMQQQKKNRTYRAPDRKASRTQISDEESRGSNSRYSDNK